MTTLGKNAQKCSEGNTIPPSTRTRAYCFTINNYSDDEWSKCQTLGDYGCIAKEVGDSGTPHIQGYFYFHNKKAFGALKKILPRAHFDIALGNQKQNRTYIFGPYKKDDKYKPENPTAIEWGEITSQGERTDLNEIKCEIENGTKVDDIVMDRPMLYHQYGRTLNKIEDIVMRKKFRTEMTLGVWYFGKTGKGKSHTAFTDYNPETCYNLALADNGWWDGYTQQDTVIINDFRGEIPYNQLLQLVDKWPYNVKRRNREPLPFLSKKVIITSSLHPSQVYHRRAEEDSLEQLYRRFDIIEI